MLRLVLITILLGASSGVFADVEELSNDDFVNGSAATFQAGFVAGEVAAARFIPQIACPCLVTKVSLLFGGSSETQEMGLQIWDDPANTDSPGFLIFSGTANLTGSNTNLQVIDLSLTPVIVNGPFRVGLEFNHSGTPTVATDTDGTINSLANFILADVGALFWFQSSLLGVNGDFIIRATIDNLTVVDTDNDGVEDATDNCTLIANPVQRDTNGDGFGNACDPDLNNDGVVNFTDISAWVPLFNTACGNVDGDFDGGGSCNFADYSLFPQYFLQPPGPSGVAP